MKLKLRGRVRWLSSIFSGTGTSVRKDGLAAYIDLDLAQFAQIVSFDPTIQLVLVQNSLDESYSLISIASLVSSSQTQQIKTTSGDVTVAATDGSIIINKTSGAATNVNFPLAASKIGDCLVTDLKLDAGTNNITLVPTSPETIQGQATYTIAGNGASLRLTPVPGIGYVL